MDTKDTFSYIKALVVNECPICASEVREIPISNEELLNMCVNTKCSYPFLPEDTMQIRKKISKISKETEPCPDKVSVNNITPIKAVPDANIVNGTPNDPTASDVFDIQSFLEQQDDTLWQNENTEGLSEIIDEILTAAGSFMFEDTG